MRREDTSLFLPLGASAFHILLALAESERHGYSISKEVEAATGGTIRLAPGSLYRQLKQMHADGWIEPIAGGAQDDPRRRYYRLTLPGRRIAQAEAERLEELVRVARTRHLLPGVSAG